MFGFLLEKCLVISNLMAVAECQYELNNTIFIQLLLLDNHLNKLFAESTREMLFKVFASTSFCVMLYIYSITVKVAGSHYLFLFDFKRNTVIPGKNKPSKRPMSAWTLDVGVDTQDLTAGQDQPMVCR